MVRELNDASRESARPGKTASWAFGVLLAAALVLLTGASRQLRVERRLSVDRMTPQEKAELARKYDLFAQLGVERREKLRQLHERIEAEPDNEKLREVMRRYCDWLDTLPDSAGYKLRELSVDERVAEIAKSRYGPQDARALRVWWDSYWRERHAAERKAAEAGARDPNAERREPPRPPMGPGGHFRFDPRRVFRQASDPGRAVSSLVKQWELDKADFTSLRANLSKATGEQFDRKSREQQQEWVAEKILEIYRQEIRRQVRGSPPVQPTDEQLSEFFRSEAVSDEEREWLMQMPGKEMHANLTRWYHMENSFRRPGPREGRDQPGPRESFLKLSPPGDGRGESFPPPPGRGRLAPDGSERDRRPRDGRRRGDTGAESP